jgi:hypothetical protein
MLVLHEATQPCAAGTPHTLRAARVARVARVARPVLTAQSEAAWQSSGTPCRPTTVPRFLIST